LGEIERSMSFFVYVSKCSGVSLSPLFTGLSTCGQSGSRSWTSCPAWARDQSFQPFLLQGRHTLILTESVGHARCPRMSVGTLKNSGIPQIFSSPTEFRRHPCTLVPGTVSSYVPICSLSFFCESFRSIHIFCIVLFVSLTFEFFLS